MSFPPLSTHSYPPPSHSHHSPQPVAASMPVFASSPHNHSSYREHEQHPHAQQSSHAYYASPHGQAAYHTAAETNVRRTSYPQPTHPSTAVSTVTAATASFSLYPHSHSNNHHPASSPTQPISSSPSSSYAIHSSYGRGYSYPTEPSFSRADSASDTHMDVEPHNMYRDARRHTQEEQLKQQQLQQQQQAYVAHAVPVVASSTSHPSQPRSSAGKRQLSGHQLTQHTMDAHMHPLHDPSPHMMPHSSGLPPQPHYGRQESPLSVASLHSATLSSSPSPLALSLTNPLPISLTAHDQPLAQHSIGYSTANEAVKQEALSPVLDDISGVSSPTHSSSAASTSSSSSATSSGSSSGSSSSSVESPFPLPRHLPVSREVLCRMPFSFVVHLRVDDRVYLPRSIVTPLTVSVSQLLHIATNISTFVAVHSTSSTPLLEDASILSIPAVFDRLRERASRMPNSQDADQLPIFKPSQPVLLPRNTPMALAVPPPVRPSGTSGKKSRYTDDCDDVDDEEEHMSENGSGGRDREVATEVAADPYSIHLLFDLAQDVKACTRLGCVNMLVKKSSRRSCDDCQNNGYQLPTDTILKFHAPQDNHAPFSHLSAIEQGSVRSQLNAAVTAAVDKLEYWKFEVPEEEAYLYAFVSVASARQAFDHFHRLVTADKSQPGLTIMSPHHELAAAGLRDVVGDSSTDSEPSVNSHSRSGSSGGSDDPSLSDSELDPTATRRRKNSTSRSTNSNSSVDMIGRSTASTSSNSSSSTHSPHVDSDPVSPIPSSVAPLYTALTGLLPSYPYSSHLRCVDSESGVYSLKMKSHFWKLEVKPHANAAQHKGKPPRVKIYKKVGAKRPAEKGSNNKRPSAPGGRGSIGTKNGGHNVAAPLAKSRPTAQSTVVDAAPDQPSIPHPSPLAAFEQRPTQALEEWAMPPTMPPTAVAAAVHQPLFDSPYIVTTRRRNGSDAEVTSSYTYGPQRSPVSTGSQLPPLFTAPTATQHYGHPGLETVETVAPPHFDCDMVLPSSFHVDDPLHLTADQVESVESFLASGYHSESIRSSAHNSVLVSRHDHEHLLKQKPIGATLSVHPAHSGEGDYDGHEPRVGVAAPTPVLLVYRDHQQYARDLSHGFLADRDGSGGNGRGGAGRDGWGGGGGGGGHDERKEGPGDRRGGGGGGGDDIDGHNGKRRRIDHHHLALDAVPPSAPASSAPSGDGGDDKKRALLQDDWLEPWKHAGAMAPAQPPSKLAALLNTQQTPVIWLCLLVALSVIGVVLFTYNLQSTGSSLQLVSMQPDNNLIAFQAKTTMSSAANMFSQMRVASPVFNSWVQAKAVTTNNLFLADDDVTTDMIYPLSSKQLDIVPGSVVGSYGVANVRSMAMLSSEQQRSMAQLNYTEVIGRCQEATNTAKAVGDFLVAANALGQAFAYHFLGTPLSIVNTTLNATLTSNASMVEPQTNSSTGGAGGANTPLESSTGQTAYNDYSSSSSSSSFTGSYELDSTGSSGGDNGGYSGSDPYTDEYVIDYRASTLSSPPKPDATCALIDHEVGMAFIRQFLCKAVANIDSPYAPILMHQCHQPQFNCTEFVWTIYASNLTNSVFAIETLTYTTDALLIALHYHQQAAVLAPTCAGFEIMTHDQLNNFQATATLAQVNVGVLVGLIMGGAALMAVGVLLVVMVVNGALKWRADKQKALADEERRRLAEERRKQALLDAADGGDVRSESSGRRSSRPHRSLDDHAVEIEMH